MGAKGRSSKYCSRCVNERDIPGQRYCRSCKNDYMSGWRKRHPVSEMQKEKNRTRAKTRYLVMRELIKKKECEMCGCLLVQAHHDDYNDAVNVRWLCAACHMQFHFEQRHGKCRQLSFRI